MMISNITIETILGKNSSPLYIISSVIFVAILFFYIFSVGSYFQVDTSAFENRVNYHKPFLTYLVGKNIDEIVIVLGTASWLTFSLLGWLKIFIPTAYLGSALFATLESSAVLDIVVLFSFPIIVSLLIYNSLAIKKILSFPTNLSLNYLAILFTVLAITSLVISFGPLFSFEPNKMPFNDYAFDIFVLFGSFSSVLISLLILGSSARLLIGKSIIKIFKTEEIPALDKKSTNKIPYLLLIMVLSIALSLIPHYPTVNSNNQEVGSDSGDYVLMLRNLMSSKDSSEFIHQTFVVQSSGDRPITLLLFYILVKIVPANPSYTLDHLPMILAPALVLSTFLLTRELVSNIRASLFAAFLTAVSGQVLIGTYGGLYANMFSLVIGYLSFVFLIRFLKKAGRINFVCYLSLIVAFVYSHVHTWTILTLVISIFLALTYKFNYYDRKRIILVFLVVLLSVGIDVSRTLITNAQGGVAQD